MSKKTKKQAQKKSTKKAAAEKPKRRPGSKTVYIGVRVQKQLSDALVAKAKKDGIGKGDACRTAFRIYTGLAKLKPVKAEPLTSIETAKKRVESRKETTKKLSSILSGHKKKAA